MAFYYAWAVQSRDLIHEIMWVCPCLPATLRQEFLSHGHLFSRAYLSTSKCPPKAAFRHVPSSHGHPCRRRYLRTSSWPARADSAHEPTLRTNRSPSSRPRSRSSRLPSRTNATKVSMSHNRTALRRRPFDAAVCSCCPGDRRRRSCPPSIARDDALRRACGARVDDDDATRSHLA